MTEAHKKTPASYLAGVFETTRLSAYLLSLACSFLA